MLAYVIGFAVVLVGVAISIALHELGHLIPAKLFRVKVTKYMIGFGPTLFSRKRGETEYGIKALPLGGYISMAGMFPPATTAEGKSAERGFFRGLIQEARDASADPNVEETRVFYKLAVWKRIIIMLGGPVMNLLLATVFFIVLLCGMGISVPSTTVGSVSQCVIPASDSTRTTCTATDPKAPAAAAGYIRATCW